MLKINQTKVDLDMYKELYGACNERVVSRDSMIDLLQKQAVSLLKERDYCKSVISVDSEIITGLQKEISSRDKKLKWAKIKNSILGSGLTLGVAGFVVIGALYFRGR